MSVIEKPDCTWIDQLYLHPDWVNKEIGGQLMELARIHLTPPIRLYTFQCSKMARTYYERKGFKAIAFGNGSGNEENCPDILYEWRSEQ